jgi:2-oxoglutarate ferredoxin oxidoreductase subunit alpha
MTATSGPGFSLMMEALGFAASSETPCVIVDVQRAGPSTGQATKPGAGDIMQSRWGSHGDYEIIALAPWSVQEMFDFAILAFNFAEQYRVPTIILADEAVAHLRESLSIPASLDVFERDNRLNLPIFGAENDSGIPPMPSFGQGQAISVTSAAHTAQGVKKVADPQTQHDLVVRLVGKIRKNADKIVMADSFGLESQLDVLVVAYGFTARAALAAVKALNASGVKAGFLRMKSIWPFPEKALKEAASKAGVIFVPEMNMGQVYFEVERVAGCNSRIVPINQVDGQVILPEKIIARIKEELE